MQLLQLGWAPHLHLAAVMEFLSITISVPHQQQEGLRWSLYLYEFLCTFDHYLSGNIFCIVWFVSKHADWVIFATLQAAINAAMPGQTIILLDNVSESNVVINNSVTIEANGFTLTIPNGTLSIPTGKSFTWKEDTLIIGPGASIVNDGTLANNGTINTRRWVRLTIQVLTPALVVFWVLWWIPGMLVRAIK